MYKRRCPWCGKIVNYTLDRKDVKKKITPRHLMFGRCVHCRNYYGQSVNSKTTLKYLIGAVFFILLSFLINNWLPFIATVVLLFIASATPVEKMNEFEETVASDDAPKIEIAVIEMFAPFKRNRLCFLSKDFDKKKCFSIVSPLRIHSFDKKKKIVLCGFLYEHPENFDYLSQDIVNLYDSNMTLIAKVSFNKPYKEKQYGHI